MSDGEIVTITQALWDMATQVGYERYEINRKKNRAYGFEHPRKTGPENDAAAARGEAAFSVWMYGFWEPAEPGAIDAGCYEVRTTDHKEDGWLKFMEWQDWKLHLPFALVVDPRRNRQYRMAGWLYGHEIVEIGRVHKQRKDTILPRHAANEDRLMMWSYAKESQIRREFPEKMVLDTSEHM